MTALTMADAEADCHGWDRPDNPPIFPRGFLPARGPVVIDGDICTGCRRELDAGEPCTTNADEDVVCLACHLTDPGDPDAR